MEAILFIIGGVWVVMGTFVVLYTDRYRSWAAGFIGRFPPRVVAFLPLVMGVLLMVSAHASHSFWFAEILGILAVVKGLLFFFLQKDRVERLFTWWQEKLSEVTQRLWGLIVVVLGIFLILRV